MAKEGTPTQTIIAYGQALIKTLQSFAVLEPKASWFERLLIWKISTFSTFSLVTSAKPAQNQAPPSPAIPRNARQLSPEGLRALRIIGLCEI